MSSEIERKFQLKRIPKDIIKDIVPLEIVQTYLQAPEGQERRVRAINNETFVITVKRPISEDGLKREENEREIIKEAYGKI
jgi:CYTH domain-containing protein